MCILVSKKMYKTVLGKCITFDEVLDLSGCPRSYTYVLVTSYRYSLHSYSPAQKDTSSWPSMCSELCMTWLVVGPLSKVRCHGRLETSSCAWSSPTSCLTRL